MAVDGTVPYDTLQREETALCRAEPYYRTVRKARSEPSTDVTNHFIFANFLYWGSLHPYT
eukprot:COSAG05_NODE_305_length_11703_cov_15.056705_9_plen_60_part_00